MTIEPFYAWAAVAPNGNIPVHSISVNRDGARYKLAAGYMEKCYGSAEEGWRRAEANGWQVIRVQIVPATQKETP